MAERDLSLALRIRAAVEGADSVDDLRRQLGDLADEIENAANPTDDFNDGLRDMDDAGQRAGRGVRDANDALGGFKEVIADIALAALAKQVLDLNDQMAALKRGFDVITGSSEKTGEALAFVRGVADKLGVGVNDLAQSYLKLTAAAKGTQLEGAATEQIFSSLAGAMSVVGAGAQEVDQAMTAMAQIMSKGVVSAEELRGQLGDVLPGAAQQAANALLVTNAEFNKMLESGEIVASEFLPKFAAQLEAAMGAGAGKVETFGAAWSRLTNALTDLATGPVGAGFTSFVAGLTEKLGLLVRGATFVSDAIGAVGTALGGLAAGEATAAMDDFGQATENAALHLFGVKTAAEEAAARQKQMVAELRAVVPEMTRFQDAVGRAELKELPEHLQAAVAEIRKTGDAATATEQAISKFFAGVQQNLTFDGLIKLAGALQSVGQEADGASNTIRDTLGAALGKLTDDQLITLKERAESAMAAASQGSEEARRAFADLGTVVEAVANEQLRRAAEESDRIAEASGRYSDALGRVASAQLAGLRAEIDLARAKGDTIAASQKSAELAELEARWAQTLAAAKQAEIAAEQAGVQAKIAELQARRDNSEAVQLEISSLQLKLAALGQEAEALKIQALLSQQQQRIAETTERNTRATEQNTAAQQANARAVTEGAKSYTLMEDAATGALRRLSGLSAGMNELIRRAEGLGGTADLFGRASDEAGKLQQQLDRVNAALAYNATVAKVGYDAFERNAAIANQAQKAYLEQAISAERLSAALEQATGNATENAASLQAIIDQAKLSRDGFDLLDQARLDNLQQALDAANEKLREMQQAADDARARLAELNAEIAAERGDTATADRLKLQLQQEQALAEIEAKIAQARAEQNQELIRLYEEQKQKLLELFALKEKNLEADIKANQTQQTTTGSAASTASTTTRSGGESAAAPSKVYQLNLVGAEGKTLAATTTTDPESFLGALSAAKARSLA